VRLKEEVRDFDAGSIIDELRPVHHNWKDRLDVWHHGVIAQEAYEVYPEAVVPGVGEPGEPGHISWGVDYSKFVPLLLREIQDLRERVAALEGKKKSPSVKKRKRR